MNCLHILDGRVFLIDSLHESSSDLQIVMPLEDDELKCYIGV